MTGRFILSVVVLGASLNGQAAAADQMLDAAERGRAYARAICSDCHVVEPSQESVAFIHSLSFEQIVTDSRMTEIAIRAFLQTPHVVMPDIILTRDQTDDLLAYMMSLKPDTRKRQGATPSHDSERKDDGR